ncbi:MAG: ABC transporter substrate-binding protein, partial [Desulfatiglandales bacterium]|nr:ABC transporter substrate-binding protein [Desulfatiglandales bacterium]
MKQMRKIMLGFLVAIFLMGLQVTSEAKKVPGVTDDTILIGAMAPITGPIASTGAAAHDSWQMVVDLANDAGGINGRKIKLIWEDTACVPAKGVAAIRKLITRDKVFALAGGVCSNAITAGVPFIEKAKVPLLTGNCSAPNMTQPLKRYIFRVATTPSTWGGGSLAKAAVEYFKEKKIGIIHFTDEYAVGQRDGAMAYLKEARVNPVFVATFSAGD